MKNQGAREKLTKQLVDMTEERMKGMLAWMRCRRTGRARRRQTPLQEFKWSLASMTNDEVKEMVAGTQERPPGYFAALILLPVLALGIIAKMFGWHLREKRSP